MSKFSFQSVASVGVFPPPPECLWTQSIWSGWIKIQRSESSWFLFWGEFLFPEETHMSLHVLCGLSTSFQVSNHKIFTQKSVLDKLPGIDPKLSAPQVHQYKWFRGGCHKKITQKVEPSSQKRGRPSFCNHVFAKKALVFRCDDN